MFLFLIVYFPLYRVTVSKFLSFYKKKKSNEIVSAFSFDSFGVKSFCLQKKGSRVSIAQG